MRYIKVSGEYHHNIEAVVPAYLLELWSNPIPMEDLIPLMAHITRWSSCHTDYQDAGNLVFENWVKDNQVVLSDWLITTIQVDAEDWEHLVTAPNSGDEWELMDAKIFSMRAVDPMRNIGITIPEEDKYSTLWLRLKDVTDQIDVRANTLKSTTSVDDLAYMVAKLEAVAP